MAVGKHRQRVLYAANEAVLLEQGRRLDYASLPLEVLVDNVRRKRLPGDVLLAAPSLLSLEVRRTVEQCEAVLATIPLVQAVNASPVVDESAVDVKEQMHRAVPGTSRAHAEDHL